MELAKEIGMKLQALREAKGLSRAHVAFALHFSTNTIYKYETGKISPSYDTLEAFSKYYGVPLTEMFKVEKKKPGRPREVPYEHKYLKSAKAMPQFRGLLKSGNGRKSSYYIYGYFAVLGGEACIIDDKDSREVYPDTVQMLVGYDAAGNEVYEGDIVEDIFTGEKAEVKVRFYADTSEASGMNAPLFSEMATFKKVVK